MSQKKEHQYIFVVGGVMSGVGKGVSSSAIGTILQARGLRVTALKIDPYVNVDAGTMNPTEHGEVFVLNDGDECDQDMGNYERFLDQDLSRIHYMTTGRVYLSVIERERSMQYQGRNVEVVPDVPEEVIRRIRQASDQTDADVTIVEVGGTIGEYQNILFLEAGRMMKVSEPDNVMFVMVSYLPIPSKVGEMKTKPTQYASRSLNSAGIQADVILARSERVLDKKRKDKIATFCNIASDRVISAPDVESIYEVPINFEKNRLGEIITEELGLTGRGGSSDLKQWKSFVNKSRRADKAVDIAVVGKYFGSGDFILADVYISVLEALKISGYHLKVKPNIHYINSEQFSPADSAPSEKAARERLKELDQYDGVLIPGGFGTRGIEGKIRVVEYLREHGIPFFGLCYGMQIAVVEYARNVAEISGATTGEMDDSAEHRVVDILPDQKEKLASGRYGNSMRLGAYPARLERGTVARRAYRADEISERHRHRFEVNPDYIEPLTAAGLVFSGRSPDGRLMEIAELPREKHPFFLATQFHPEFQARPLKPHPLFSGFIKAALARNQARE